MKPEERQRKAEVFARSNDRSKRGHAKQNVGKYSPPIRNSRSNAPNGRRASVRGRRVKENFLSPKETEEHLSLVPPTPLKLSWVVFFGDTQFILSILSLAWSLLIIVIKGESLVVYFVVVCIIYHMISSICIVFVAKDAAKYEAWTPFCVCAELLGLVIAIVLIVSDYSYWKNYTDLCQNCWNGGAAIDDNCDSSDCKFIDEIHVTVGIFAVVFGIIDLIVSFIICWHLWKFWEKIKLRRRRAGRHHRITASSFSI